jgi:hypothetical protein
LKLKLSEWLWVLKKKSVVKKKRVVKIRIFILKKKRVVKIRVFVLMKKRVVKIRVFVVNILFGSTKHEGSFRVHMTVQEVL